MITAGAPSAWMFAKFWAIASVMDDLSNPLRIVGMP